jgi:hypothetical protein
MTITVDGVRHNLPQYGLCAEERGKGPELEYDYEYAHEFRPLCAEYAGRKVYKTGEPDSISP